LKMGDDNSSIIILSPHDFFAQKNNKGRLASKSISQTLAQ
jgi:hypothetical protein